MSNILDQIQKSRARAVPETVKQFFALRIATHLGDQANGASYLGAADRHTIASLLRAFHQVKTTSLPEGSFLDLLKSSPPQSDEYLPSIPLLAIRIMRRTVAAAVFSQMRLEHVLVRELPSTAQAEGRATGFVQILLSRFPGSLVALEEVEEGAQTRKKAITSSVIKVLREAGRPIALIEKEKLISSFTPPPSKNRRAELRRIMEGIYPDLPLRFSNRGVLDAAALGLLIQADRYLSGGVAPAPAGV